CRGSGTGMMRVRTGCVRVLTLVTAALALVAAATDAGAQSPCPSCTAAPRWEVGGYLGVAVQSPVGTYFGSTPDRNHVFIGLQATKEVLAWKRWLLAFAPQVVPLAIVTNNPKYDTQTITTPSGSHTVTVETGRGPVYGVGFVPLGLEMQLQVASRWRVYGGGAVGGIWFTRDVPVGNSKAFNYTFEFGGGLQYQCRPGQWLRVGYKFHHLSNAGSVPINPGVDANMFLAGYSVVVGSHKH
ncbi:MAG: acyloxyacyl hydrolase, partial [Acidobacteria bacterium]|nr:acyloxyacyl hydrolase [Acidobacteriota bacterium]